MAVANPLDYPGNNQDLDFITIELGQPLKQVKIARPESLVSTVRGFRETNRHPFRMLRFCHSVG